MTFNFNDRTLRILITAVAGVLGNLLAFLSSMLTPMHPQVSFDFSHLATFAVAIAFGPIYGMLTGAIVSIYPYIQFAVQGIYGPFAGLAIIFGKAMTGFVCGCLRGRLPPFFTVIVSYIPECLFTLGFLQLMSLYLPAGSITWTMISDIIVEAWVEIIIFAIIINTVIHRQIMEIAIIMLEIFIIMFLVHKEFTQTLLIILLITVITVLLFELVRLVKKKQASQTPKDNDDSLI